MTDVLLTHSYHLYYDRKQARKMQPYPPLGTMYAAALLRQQGYTVAMFDTMLKDPEQGFAAALERHRPRVVAIYEDNFNFLSKMCLTRMRDVAFRMTEEALAAGAVVVANGSDASDRSAQYLRHGVTAVLLGEAEWTLLDVVRNLSSGVGLEQVDGLAYLRDGQVLRTPARGLQRDLDRLPFPARELMDVDAYRNAWKATHGVFSLNLVASRGCPYRCNWCAKPIYGNSYHVRSAASVAEEMALLKHRFGAEHLWFCDDIFALRAAWAQDLAIEVERRDGAVPFKMQSRVDLMTPFTVQALRRAGCAEVWMGAESGSQAILDAMDKDTLVDEIAAARETLRANGIRACYFLQFGYPGETWEDIQKTIRLVRDTRPDDVGISVSYPLPGTRFFRNVQAQLGSKTNWSDSDDLSVMFRGAYTDEFYRALHDALHAEVDTWSDRGPLQIRDRVVAGTQETRALWARVEELEKTSRNPNPTLPLIQLACADAWAD